MKYLFVLPLFLIAFSGLAQKKGANIYSISYGHGNGEIRPFAALAKSNGTNSKGPVNLFGLNYYGGIGKHAYIETGISLLTHRYTFKEFGSPEPKPIVNKSYNAFFIPFKIRFDIAKFFFISGGLSADFNVKGGSSLGAGIGAGVQYYHKKGYGIFIYPQTNVHDLAIGLVERNISFGLAYRIPRR
ncbi:hypothetical protein [Pedobacter sp. Hv1]|uniref:hypothetical protein n=1 Tax=Pedobacter sp. Hv1 TaxID=1740090 RepID=UPI0006D8B5B0|nr:hypothetical protein [Pedobacter sp. Hv1]KQC01516.1 hypothetical protein AQF98_07360 [Pedobacter sp. Hv1]